MKSVKIDVNSCAFCDASRKHVPMPIGGSVRDIERCLASVIAALNAGGVMTKASCCGHGKRWGNIALEDGRELFVIPDHQTARRLELILNREKKERGDDA